MGITGFYSFFNQASQIKYVSELRGSIVAIDLSGILIKFGIGIRKQGFDKKNKHGKVINHLYAIVKYTLNLVDKGIFPYYVFDGKTSRHKVSVSERSQNRITSSAKCSAIEDKKSPEFIKHFKRGYTFSRSDIEECKKLLELMGIPFIHAPEEADSQCAALAHKYPHLISGVITNDSDILIYGCPKMYKDFNPKIRTMIEYNYADVIDIFHKKINDVLESIGKPPIEYDIKFIKDALRHFCILMGSDYGKLVTVKCADKNNILLKLFVESNFDINEFVNKFKTQSEKNLFHISDTILEDFHKADSEYKDSFVLMPEEDTITIKPPNEDMLTDFFKEHMSYDSGEISTIIKTISTNYTVFNKMRHLCNKDRFGEPQANVFSSFNTYRFKYCKKLLNSPAQEYQEPPVDIKINNRWDNTYNNNTNNRWNCRRQHVYRSHNPSRITANT
jgi:5'-3' exonuclease